MGRFVHYNKCTGGHAFEEIDHKTYCLGQTDSYFEETVYLSECQKCPRLLKNNEDKIAEYAKKHCKGKVIVRGNCMACGKDLTSGLFFCKECEVKGRRTSDDTGRN